MSNWTFVNVSYGLTWVVLIGYFWSVRQKVRRAERQLEEGQ